jgi:2-hydroxychromene-2-carboxylate isomerase
MTQIEFLYDVVSPNAFLVHKVLPALAARHGASVVPVPVLLGGVFKATGNQPPIVSYRDVSGKLAYQRTEIQRFIRRHGLTFHMNPHFPMQTVAAMRGAIHAHGKPWEAEYIDAVFDAVWVHGQKLDDEEVLLSVIDDAGLPRNEIAEAIHSDAVKTALRDATDTAVARGVFGTPTMFLGDDMFFGKDSLDDLAWMLTEAA